MQQPSPVKSIVSGAVGGALGAALAAGVMAVFGALDLRTTGYGELLALLAAGVASCIALAFVYRKLPQMFAVQVLLATIVFTGVSWVAVFPQMGIPFSGQLAVISVIANVVFGIMAMFVLHQAIGLALPNVPMSRRAEEFEDHPSGA